VRRKAFLLLIALATQLMTFNSSVGMIQICFVVWSSFLSTVRLQQLRKPRPSLSLCYKFISASIFQYACALQSLACCKWFSLCWTK